ncbi:unnamed protein product [Prunus armeniaca]
MEWISYCIVLSIGFRSQLPKSLVPPCYDVPQFYSLDFTQNSPNCSSLYVIMFPKFRTQSDIDWSVKLFYALDFTHNYPKGSYEVRYEMEWLVYCTLLSIGFHSKLTK